MMSCASGRPTSSGDAQSHSVDFGDAITFRMPARSAGCFRNDRRDEDAERVVAGAGCGDLDAEGVRCQGRRPERTRRTEGHQRRGEGAGEKSRGLA